MRISETWLRDWVETPIPFADLAAVLTRGGFEIEATGTVGASHPDVVVGRILAAEPHPQADRLRVCRVDLGPLGSRTIVCGAANARPGLLAPVALPGARIGERVIEAADLRGVRSEGMLCAAAELGCAEWVSGDGLWELPPDAPVGTWLQDYLNFAEGFLDIAVTPNRGDCLSVRGLAREIAALTRTRVRGGRARALRVHGEAPVAVVVATIRCPRYLVRCISGVETMPASPGWLVRRLRVGGVTPRHPVVDVTNYIMLDLGQPLHAFDADAVQGPLTVRLARAGESLTLLDGSQPTLTTEDLVIADDSGPLALAGILGGTRAAVSAQTRNVLIEAAYFRPEALSRTARRLGLITDAALRFERGVDPELAPLALERASALILRICGLGTAHLEGTAEPAGGRKGITASASPVAESVTEDEWPARPPIRLRLARIPQLLGVTIPRVQVTRFLQSLGMAVARSHGDLSVRAPSFRFDIEAEIDLIEEVARLWGYEEIPGDALPLMPVAAPPQPGILRRMRDLLMDRDYHEAVTFSLIDPAEHRALHVDSGIALQNPLAGPWAGLRQSLVPGLLAAALYNRHRQQARVRLFEIGIGFEWAAEAIIERPRVAGVALGSAEPEQWGIPARAGDFFDIKGDVEALASLIGPLRARPCEHQLLQPGLSATLFRGDRPVGFLGALAPEHRERLGFHETVWVFEIEGPFETPARPTQAPEVARFPAVRRDIAVIVPEKVTAGQVMDTVRESAGPLLQELVLFDVYRGEGLDLGKKSLALGLTLRDFSRTLTDERVDEVVAQAVRALADAHGAQLRQ